jgi:hypothetical protein
MGHHFVPAGPGPVQNLFDYMTAEQVSKCHQSYQCYCPPKSFSPIIDGYEQEKKNI